MNRCYICDNIADEICSCCGESICYDCMINDICQNCANCIQQNISEWEDKIDYFNQTHSDGDGVNWC